MLHVSTHSFGPKHPRTQYLYTTYDTRPSCAGARMLCIPPEQLTIVRCPTALRLTLHRMVRMLARFKKRKTPPRWVKPAQRAREQLAAQGCKVLSKAEMAQAEDTVRGEIPQPDDPMRLPDAVSVQDVRTLDELREVRT